MNLKHIAIKIRFHILKMLFFVILIQSCGKRKPVLSVPDIFNANDFSETYSSFSGYNSYGVPLFSQMSIPAVADLGLGSIPVFFIYNSQLCWSAGNSFPIFMSSPRNAFFSTRLKIKSTQSYPVYNYYLGYGVNNFVQGNYIYYFWDTQSANTIDYLVNIGLVEPPEMNSDMYFFNFIGNKGKNDFDPNENPSRNSYVAFYYDASTGAIDTINIEHNANVTIQGQNIVTVQRKFPYSGNGDYTMEFNIDADNTLPDKMVDDGSNSVNVSFTF